MDKRLYAWRGAVCVENTAESITENVCLMCRELFSGNNICVIVKIIYFLDVVNVK